MERARLVGRDEPDVRKATERADEDLEVGRIASELAASLSRPFEITELDWAP
jgi:hypothetical protein